MTDEVKKTGFKALLQSAQLYVWAGLLILSAITFVYTKGMKAERKDSGNATVVTDVKTIRENQTNMNLKLDLLIVNLDKTNTKLDAYAESHNALQKSYKLYLQDNIKYSKVLMPYVNGLIELQKKSEYLNQIPRQDMTPYDSTLILTLKQSQ